MDIGATKIEGPRKLLQETPSESAGGSAPTSASTCSNLPLDDAKCVALETTPNPLAYWPPPSSALPPINSSKDTADGSQNAIAPSEPVDSSKNEAPDKSSPGFEEKPAVSKSNEVSHPVDEGLSSTSANQPTKTLHHNLPPIAGITSSHNYRGVREVQKQSDGSKSVPKPGSEKSKTDGEVGDEKRSDGDPAEAPPPAKIDSEPAGDCEIVEVTTKTANQEHVFSIPAAVNAKAMPSPRAPTPFVHAVPPVTEALTLNINSCSNSSAGSPSPSGRAVPSPQFVAPSPTMTGNMQCPSPSNLHRVLSSSHLKMPSPGDGSRMLHSPHLGVPSPTNPVSPSMPYVPNSHSNLTYLNTPRNNFNESPVQNQPDTSRPRSANEEGDRNRQNLRMGFPKPNIPLINSTQTVPPRIDQTMESQICRNPFELPMPKPYPQQYQQPQQQQQHVSHYPNLPRHSSDPHAKMEHYMNLVPPAKDQHRSIGSSYPGFKPMSPRLEKDPLTMNSQPATHSKGPYSMEPTNEQRTQNPMRSDVPQRMEMSKPNGPTGVSAWNKPELTEIGNKNNPYLNAQNKSFNKVNGNEFANRRIPETGYQNPVKQGVHVSEGFGGRYNVTNSDKQSAGFSAVNQMSSISQRFPPVPQSNYDLNRQIYDTMTGGSRAVQPPGAKPLEKPVQQFPPSKEQTAMNPQMCKTQTPYYPNFSEAEKGKNYVQSIPMKQTDYPGQPRRPAQDYRSNSYAHYNNLADKSTHDAAKRSQPSQPPVSSAFQPQVQVNESRHAQPGPGHEHHKPLNQGFPPRVSTSHHVSQSPLPSDRNRQMPQAQPMFLPKQGLPEYDPKKAMEVKPKATPSQFPTHQNLQPSVHSGQPKIRTPSSTAAPARSKRESPLDLSVKTVRQSADSTAKDDGEVYLQSFRNFLQGSSQPARPEGRYAVSQSNESALGAPKIDFTPNFSGFHTETQNPGNPPVHHKTETSVLPPVESFKKFPARLPTPAPQDPKLKPSLSKYFSPPAMSNQKPQSSSTEPGRYPPDHFKEAQKRPAMDSTITHSSQPKIPKIDSWKLAFDQQIEQRLNSARISHQNSQNALNGVDASKAPPVTSQYPSSYQTSRHSSSHYRGANMYPRPPVQTSATPYNPSYVQQPQCQPATPQTPQEKLQHRENVGHSPDPEQIIKQISKGVMPDHKLLQDKNVLSILRSSLEEKEAKLMQLREAARRKEKYKELMTSDLGKRQFQAYDQATKGQTHSKQSLPPFGALTLERMCAPPSFPGHRLNLPKPVDTVKIDIEPTQKYFSPAVKNEAEKSGIPNVNLSPQDDAQGPPTDFDGLAAFLAARIRTKGELKQVGPTLDPGRPASGQQLKSLSGSGAPLNESMGHVPGQAPQPGALPSGGSPPKLVRESRLLPPLRRRLFSHTEEETPTTSGTQHDDHSRVPPRDPNGIRSSSETSVFDFRESDSEGEMPVLERQTLEGMRRDRKTFGSKQNVSTTTPDEVMDVDKPEVIAELNKSHPDPFWDTAFDMFVEQLEKRPPKRSVRKKRICSRIPHSGPESEDSDKVKVESDNAEKPKTSQPEESETKVEEPNESSVFEVKKEPEDKVENAQDGHVKLSSSRLKNYKDDMLKQDRLKEVKTEDDAEKTSKTPTKEIKSKEPQTKKDEERKKKDGGIKTRGKSRVEKEAVITDYDSDSDERDRSDSESISEDDDDSLSLSGLESESTDSESSEESSNSNASSYDDSESETVAKKRIRVQTRLQTRSSKQKQARSTGMKLRSKATPLPKSSAKPTKKKKKRKEEYYSSGKKKKPAFGDGSEFRPGWEEECYKFKQQLRMPEKLISISRPPKRSSASLPDLDPYRNSPSLDSSDVSLTRKSDGGKAVPETDESDTDATKKSKTQEDSAADADNPLVPLLKLRNGKKSQPSSIINLLVDKYGKGDVKKQKELKAMNERKSPRILPKATNKPELLPTPSLGIGKENVLKDKKRSKDSGKKKIEETDSVYLGYFRRKTVNNFKETFAQKVGILPTEFSPVVLKSRTRTQTRDLKKKATLMEVFGEERPASAPPLSREEDASTDQEKSDRSPDKKKPKIVKKVCGGVVTRGRGKLTRSGRPGLRSTAVLRSNKAIQNSKRHLNSGRKRNMELLRIRAMASKKFSYLVSPSDGSNPLPITKKRLKLRSVRRKFRSGFDYIRKKKKMKKDGDSADGSVKEKRLPSRPTSESVEDVQNEIKNWVINKGLGETILHRAARLGYTDVAAYCLEKMDCSPSPRDNAGYTPLHEACSRGHLDIAKLLLMYGASVSESAKGGVRPLHEAAENGFTELIRLLLSYGADPLLETYTGHTALSLVSDEEARRLMQHHLADVQGNVAPVWTFQGPASLFDPVESGYDPLSDPPSPHSNHSDYELEISDVTLPPLYRLTGDRSEPDRRWVLMRDLLSCAKVKSKDVVLKQLGSPSVREMKLSDFYEQSKCCNLMGAGEKPLTKASKVILVPYDEKVRQMLGVEKVVV